VGWETYLIFKNKGERARTLQFENGFWHE